jgi:hypothetical protein
VTRYRVRGPNGAEAVVEVPSPGMDERTFKGRVDAGELTVLDGDGDGAQGDGGQDSEPPSKRAPKEEWVAYASRVHDIPAEEAEAMTKAELVETFGG